MAVGSVFLCVRLCECTNARLHECICAGVRLDVSVCLCVFVSETLGRAVPLAVRLGTACPLCPAPLPGPVHALPCPRGDVRGNLSQVGPLLSPRQPQPTGPVSAAEGNCSLKLDVEATQLYSLSPRALCKDIQVENMRTSSSPLVCALKSQVLGRLGGSGD